MSCPTCGGGYGVHDDYTHGRGEYADELVRLTEDMGLYEDESDICPATLAHGIGVYHCRLLGEHREHEAGDLRWTTP